MRLPSGVASILLTVSLPPFSGPANVCARKPVRAPVAGFSEAIWPRTTVPILVKSPVTTSWPRTSRMSRIEPPPTVGTSNPVTRAPVATVSRATFDTAVPPMLVNFPPTNTEVPSPDGMTAVTSPFIDGAKVVEIAPVVASNAAMRLRVSTGDPGAGDWIDVKVPPITIWLPTWAIASTLPLRTLGVQLAGVADTTLD